MSSDLQNARNQCNTGSILCVGGGLNNSDILKLVSCADCYKVLTQTTFNQVIIGSAFWYMAHGKSFGFSPNYNIQDRDSYNIHNLWDQLCLSWNLNNTKGGFRLGDIQSFNDNVYGEPNSDSNQNFLNEYKKYIFIKV